MSKLPIVAITGRPNVGKSSLFNRLIGERRAIVADEAGTTRDAVRSIAEWNSKQFWLVDTAGLQPAGSQLESDMQAQIEEAREAADVIVVVIEAGVMLTDADHRAAKLALKSKKPVILAVNKLDVTHNKVPKEVEKLGIKQVVGVSAIHGNGSGDLLDTITAIIPKRKEAEIPGITISLLGRPNVGKSSIFNRLLGNQKAIVSGEAGTTRDVNRQVVRYYNEDFVLFDTAGIRKRGKIKNTEFFSLLRTTQAINEADVCILVIDATEPSVALDQKIAGMVKEAGKGLIVAINKWDLVKNEEDAQSSLERLIHGDFQFAWWAPLILTSAQEGHNIFKLFKLAKEVQSRRTVKLSTSKVNNVVRAAIANHPPAGLKNRHPKLNYATQTGINPPEITLFGAHLDFLHWSYRRYLETQLRNTFDFTGTPIKLVLSSKYKESEKV